MTDFSHISLEAWQALVMQSLKEGRSFDSLFTPLPDGVQVAPLYAPSSAPAIARAGLRPWAILQRIDHPQPLGAAQQVADELAGGADGLVLVDYQHPHALGFGLKSPQSLPRILANVDLHSFTFRLEGGDALASSFAKTVEGQPLDPARLRVSFGLEPPQLWPDLHAQGFSGPFFTADGSLLHQAGYYDAVELGGALRQLVLLFRRHEDCALGAAQLVDVKLAAHQDMFVTLAKFRAMRLLWVRLLQLCQLPFCPLTIHGESSLRMMAVKDPHSNLLRTTAAVFGASLGGCDSFNALAFSILQGLPNHFARRMARNNQLILRDESQLWRVIDAAHGSGYIDFLTQQLAEKAWDHFTDMEKTGKLPPLPSSPDPLAPLIGSSLYPLATEYEAAIESLGEEASL